MASLDNQSTVTETQSQSVNLDQWKYPFPHSNPNALTNDEKNKVKKAISKQVEFYFSEFNLPRDKFLKEQVQSNEQGFVKLETLKTFTKMKPYTKFEGLIEEALKESKVLELNETNDMVHLKEPISLEENKEKTLERTVYCKGFDKHSPSTIRDTIRDFIIEFMDGLEKQQDDIETEDQVARVDLRYYVAKDGKKGFKGSALVEFYEPKYAQRFLEHYTNSPKEFQNQALELKSGKEYQAREDFKNKDYNKETQEWLQSSDFKVDQFIKIKGVLQSTYLVPIIEYLSNNLKDHKITFFEYDSKSNKETDLYSLLNSEANVNETIEAFNKEPRIVELKNFKDLSNPLEIKLVAEPLEDSIKENIEEFKKILISRKSARIGDDVRAIIAKVKDSNPDSRKIGKNKRNGNGNFNKYKKAKNAE